MLKHMPSYYKASEVMTNIVNAEGIEIDLFKQKLDSVMNQFFVDSADFTLEKWEKELGLKINNSKPAEHRRSVIKSKLRGQGTVTVTLIKNVSESYTNGEVDVIENNSNYNFVVKFVGIRGVPPNLDDLQKAIEEIKPAHLGFRFEFTYMTWDQFDNYNLIWNDWDALNLTWNEFEIYQE